MAARRYLRSAAGASPPSVETIVLHDTHAGTMAVVGPREWAILRCADGSRDLEGVRRAVERRSVRVGEGALATFFAALGRAGLLGSAASAPPTDASPPRPTAPLDPLADFLLDCDGRGSCCRIYGSTLFSPDEARRAVVLCPEAAPPDGHGERAFTPESGSSYRLARGAERARAAGVVDGRCLFLGAEERCSLHERGGRRAKPLGCRLFPADFADDGEAIRVSVQPECACVMRSIETGAGEPLVAEGARTGADLDPDTLVRLVPTRVALGNGQTTSRRRYLDWARGTAARLGPLWRQPADPPATEIAGWAWRAGALLAGGGALEEIGAFDAAPLPAREEVSTAVTAYRSIVEGLLARWREMRHARDLSVTTAEWLRAALDHLASDRAPCLPGASAVLARREAFSLHAWLHSHQLVGEVSLGTALQASALRMLLARAMARLPRPSAHDGALAAVSDEPLALVNAWWRSHGLAGRAAPSCR